MISYAEPVLVEDILGALDQMAVTLDAVPAPVNVIVDLTEARRIPANLISSYPRISQHPGVAHRNAAHSYVVIESNALTSIIGIFDKLFVKFQIVRTFDEAMRLIDEERAAHSEAPEE